MLTMLIGAPHHAAGCGMKKHRRSLNRYLDGLLLRSQPRRSEPHSRNLLVLSYFRPLGCDSNYQFCWIAP